MGPPSIVARYTTSPVDNLGVNGAIGLYGGVTNANGKPNAANQATIFVDSDSGNALRFAQYNNYPFYFTSGAVRGGSNGTTYLTINGAASGNSYFNTGNVGIGTTNPYAALQVGTPTNATGSMSTVLASYGGTLGSVLGNTVNVTSLGFGTNGNTVALGVHAYRTLGGVSDFKNLSIGLGIDVDNTSYGTNGLWINNAGNVGIGTTSPRYPLSVNGIIQAKEVLVNTGWSDYVFDPKYRLKPLQEVATYIRENHHLPDIPSAKEVETKGVNLGNMQSKLLAKVEELTLHMIEAERENRELRERIARLEAARH